MCKTVLDKLVDAYNHPLHGCEKPKPSFVYFVTDGEYVKIGKTDNDVQSRIAALQTGNPKRIFPLIQLPLSYASASQNLESYFHNMFADKRMCGEWFDILYDSHLYFYYFRQPDLYQTKDTTKFILRLAQKTGWRDAYYDVDHMLHIYGIIESPFAENPFEKPEMVNLFKKLEVKNVFAV